MSRMEGGSISDGLEQHCPGGTHLRAVSSLLCRFSTFKHKPRTARHLRNKGPEETCGQSFKLPQPPLGDRESAATTTAIHEAETVREGRTPGN